MDLRVFTPHWLHKHIISDNSLKQCGSLCTLQFNANSDLIVISGKSRDVNTVFNIIQSKYINKYAALEIAVDPKWFNHIIQEHENYLKWIAYTTKVYIQYYLEKKIRIEGTSANVMKACKCIDDLIKSWNTRHVFKKHVLHGLHKYMNGMKRIKKKTGVEIDFTVEYAKSFKSHSKSNITEAKEMFDTIQFKGLTWNSGIPTKCAAKKKFTPKAIDLKNKGKFKSVGKTNKHLKKVTKKRTYKYLNMKKDRQNFIQKCLKRKIQQINVWEIDPKQFNPKHPYYSKHYKRNFKFNGTSGIYITRTHYYIDLCVYKFLKSLRSTKNKNILSNKRVQFCKYAHNNTSFQTFCKESQVNINVTYNVKEQDKTASHNGLEQDTVFRIEEFQGVRFKFFKSGVVQLENMDQKLFKNQHKFERERVFFIKKMYSFLFNLNNRELISIIKKYKQVRFIFSSFNKPNIVKLLGPSKNLSACYNDLKQYTKLLSKTAYQSEMAICKNFYIYIICKQYNNISKIIEKMHIIRSLMSKKILFTLSGSKVNVLEAKKRLKKMINELGAIDISQRKIDPLLYSYLTGEHGRRILLILNDCGILCKISNQHVIICGPAKCINSVNALFSKIINLGANAFLTEIRVEKSERNKLLGENGRPINIFPVSTGAYIVIPSRRGRYGDIIICVGSEEEVLQTRKEIGKSLNLIKEFLACHTPDIIHASFINILWIRHSPIKQMHHVVKIRKRKQTGIQIQQWKRRICPNLNEKLWRYSLNTHYNSIARNTSKIQSIKLGDAQKAREAMVEWIQCCYMLRICNTRLVGLKSSLESLLRKRSYHLLKK